ncbi:unnamed protein product [Brassica oleracea]|uniref:Uncharacterized protein n=1 Tax=Brassica oleracea TaxID=3712 RepID=A0A3P6FQ66_BRAOL|nr:unnamed protein product [Brassica oleracea]
MNMVAITTVLIAMFTWERSCDLSNMEMLRTLTTIDLDSKLHAVAMSQRDTLVDPMRIDGVALALGIATVMLCMSIRNLRHGVKRTNKWSLMGLNLRPRVEFQIINMSHEAWDYHLQRRTMIKWTRYMRNVQVVES